jgi:hypothetical protein
LGRESCDKHGEMTMSGEAEHSALVSAREVYRALLRVHRAELDDSHNGPEWLEEASCPPGVKELARLASSASVHGMTAEGWRSMIMSEGGPEASPLLDNAETCMRESGLWPWNQV